MLVIVMVPFSYWSVLWNSRTFDAHVPVQVVLFFLLACLCFYPACGSSVFNLKASISNFWHYSNVSGIL